MKTLLASFLMWIVPLGVASARERFFCNAKALAPAERARYQELTQSLLAAVQEKQELKNGYAFRLPATSLKDVAEWVSLERKCCPFFTFEIEQTRDLGPIWLRLTGSEGVKAFIRAEFGM